MWDSPEDEKKKKDPTQDYVPPESPSDLKRKEAIKGYYQDAWEKKQKGLDDNVKTAQSQQEMGQYADVAGNLFTNYANSQKSPTILANRMQDLGKQHNTIEPEEQKWKSVAPAFDKQVEQAHAARDSAYKGMKQDIELQSIDTKIGDENVARERNDLQYDSTSELSKMAQVLAKSSLASKAKEAEAAGDKDAAARLRAIDTSSMTAQEAKTFADSLKGTDYKDVISNNNAQAQLKSQNDNQAANRALTGSAQDETNRHNLATEENAALEAQAKANAAKAPKTLSAEQQGRYDSASMGLKALGGMKEALKAGDNTFTLPGMGDNDFTRNATLFEEALGRMQSGGAIQKDEAERFRGMAPTKWDSPEMQEKKLADLEAEMSARIRGLGKDPAEAVASRTPQAPAASFDFDAEDKRRGLK